MAPVITEIHDGRRFDSASNTATRLFRVYESGVGVTEPAAIQVAADSGLVRGAAHPDKPLALYSLQTQQNNAVVDITAQYVLQDLVFPPAPVNPLSPNFQSMTGTYRREQVDLPYFRVVKDMVDGPNDTVTELMLWRGMSDGRAFSKRQHVWTYRLSGEFVQSLTVAQWLQQMAVIDSQADKLHRFNGAYYRFEPGQLNQESVTTSADPARWRIEYNWVYDPGIRVRDPGLLSVGAEGPGGSNNNVNLRHFYRQLPIGTSRYFPVEDPANRVVLGPFRTVETADHPDGAQFPPLTVFSDEFEKDDNGWQVLPGLGS
jgi:hypothetical protein